MSGGAVSGGAPTGTEPGTDAEPEGPESAAGAGDAVVADAVRVFLEPGGIVVDFGRTASESDDEVVIEHLDRVVMPPATFRRMGLGLHDALRDLARRSPGPRRAPGPPPPTPSKGPTAAGRTAARPASRRPESRPALEVLLDPTRHMGSSKAEPSAGGRDASRLFRLVADLGVTFIHERSFRMRQGALLPNRYLLTVGRQSEGLEPDEILTGVLRELDMPTVLLLAAEEALPRARCVHFGFEAEEDSHLLKVYLEVAEGARHDGDDGIGPDGIDDPEPVLEHLAFKWDPTDHERAVEGRYLHFPAISVAGIHGRLADIYAGTGANESLEIARGVLALAAERMPARDIHYLEVGEAGNERRSYSINFYDAGLHVRDLQPLLARMRRQYGVAPGAFQALYDQIKTRRFGHLAGGVHRNGRDFFNVYYGPQVYQEGTWRGAASREGIR